MPNYNAPGIYIQDEIGGSQTIDQQSSSIGCLFGQTRSGTPNVLQKVTSWTEFIEKYANGLETPFISNSYLPYAVYGFFQNGGNYLYVCNIKKNAIKARITTTGSKITFIASSEGTWANGLRVKFTRSGNYTNTNRRFDVKFILGNNSVTLRSVKIENLVKSVMASPRLRAWIGSVTLANDSELAEETAILAGGTDGDTLTDTEYLSALNLLDTIDDVTMVGIPGQTSNNINNGLISYCETNNLFPIIDMPRGATIEDTYEYREGISAFTGALAYPWGKVNDPITNTLIAVPTVGHVMGVYARTIETRGVFKVPAGLEASVNGFVEMETALTTSQVDILNPVGVICIVSRPNAGIVIWGARSLNSTDKTMRYVSDGLLNLNIKKSLYTGTQFAIFEPNNADLWSRLETACTSFLEDLRNQGALRGEPKEAYYVTVNSTNNTETSIESGELNIEVGYAPVKPAEFIVIKLSHSITANNSVD